MSVSLTSPACPPPPHLLFSCCLSVQAGWTALMWAASEGHGGTVKELIRSGAKLDLLTKVQYKPPHDTA